MKPNEIAQWVIDNRYPKSDTDKISDLEMYHFIADRIHDLTRWIPVSERMPTHEDFGEWGRVLIRYNDGDIDSMPFVGNVSQFTTSSEFWITHWQRITPPEAP